MSDEAAQLVKVPMELIEQVLLKFQAASLDQWKAEITALRKQLKDCSTAFDRQQEMLDRNAGKIAALRLDAERYGRAKRFLQYGKGTLDARGTDSAAFDALIDALPKEEGK